MRFLTYFIIDFRTTLYNHYDYYYYYDSNDLYI